MKLSKKINCNIVLKNNKGYKWHIRNGIYVKGFAYIENILIENDSFIETLKDISTKEHFEDKIKTLNGCFSIIIEKEATVFSAVDHTRSMPLYYSEKYNWIGDQPDSLTQQFDCKKDPISVREFFCTGYVTGKNTIYSDINQLQAGEYLIIKNKKLQTTTYYEYLHQDFIHNSENDTLKKLNKIVTNAMKRLITLANGKQLVIPLSGGYDSRLIALKLKELNYTNVLCFSYGKKNNWESLIAKKVAHLLNFKYLFIDYKPIVKKIYNSFLLKDYDSYTFQGTSIPHVQDYFAVHELKEKKKIEATAIFVPGHSADFLAGSHLTSIELKNKLLSTNDVITQILKKHYNIFTPNKKKPFKKKIQSIIPPHPKIGDASSIVDHWNWRERQAKYIIHSCRVYEFFGYQWHCPLWDKEITEFFKTLPIKYRKNKWLYNKFVDSLDQSVSKVGTSPSLLLKIFQKIISVFIPANTTMNFKKHSIKEALLTIKILWKTKNFKPITPERLKFVRFYNTLN